MNPLKCSQTCRSIFNALLKQDMVQSETDSDCSNKNKAQRKYNKAQNENQSSHSTDPLDTN